MQDQPHGMGFQVPEEASHLSVNQVMNAAKMTMFIHANAFEHSLVIIGNPSHQCDITAEDDPQFEDEEGKAYEVSWDDVRALVAYEDSMKLVIGSMKKYMTNHGFFFSDEEPTPR